MAILPITKYGASVLRAKAKEVAEVTPEIRKIVEDMFESMYAARGIGLAAPQIGLSQQIIVLDGSPHYEDCEKIALVNPVILENKGEDVMTEGCLSVPGLEGDVARATELVVQGLDLSGKQIEIKAKGMQARIFQHEIDHINGMLYIDRVSPLARTMMQSKLKKLQKEAEKL